MEKERTQVNYDPRELAGDIRDIFNHITEFKHIPKRREDRLNYFNKKKNNPKLRAELTQEALFNHLNTLVKEKANRNKKLNKKTKAFQQHMGVKYSSWETLSKVSSSDWVTVERQKIKCPRRMLKSTLVPILCKVAEYLEFTGLENLVIGILKYCQAIDATIPALSGHKQQIEKLTGVTESPQPTPQPTEHQPQPTLELPDEKSNINHYTNRVIEHVLGREEEQQYLHYFLNSKHKSTFSWLQLAGVAGQGKSRLALELMLEAKKDSRWTAGGFKREHFNGFTGSWGTWQPNKPYLFVIDYVIGNEDWINPFFRALSTREDFHHPVRVLIVERQRWDKGGFAKQRYRHDHKMKDEHQSIISSIDSLDTDSYAEWFLSLTKSTDNDKTQSFEKINYVKNCISTHYIKEKGILELKALDSDALFLITEQIVLHEGITLKISKSEVIKRLEQIDSSGRPLFAYLFGQALAAGGGENEDIYSRNELLRNALKRQYQRRWVSTFGEDVPIRRDDNIAHRLAVISTIVGGLDYKRAKDYKFIPLTDANSIRRAMVLTDTPPRTDDEYTPGNIILPLEPDILGEWMVLDSFYDALPVDDLMDIAWSYNPKETASFIQRLTQDFPEHLMTEEILQQYHSDEQSLVYFSRVSSAIFYNLSQHDHKYEFPSHIYEALQYAAKIGEDTVAMANLGACYANGTGVEQSYEQAVKWYRKAANKGYVPVMFYLGTCYANGQGVDQSDKRAAKWYREAADKDDVQAMLNLGACYDSGKGVEQSHEEAVEWYRKAEDKMDALEMLNFDRVQQSHEQEAEYSKVADKDDASTMSNLGVCYAKGDGVEQIYKQAVEWYRKAADKDDASAIFYLGVCLYEGEGVEKSEQEALKWFRKSADLGHEDARLKCLELGQRKSKGSPNN